LTDKPTTLKEGEWVEFYPAPKVMIIGTIGAKELEEDFKGLCWVQTRYALFDEKLDRSFSDGFLIHPSKLRKIVT
jgi:hypothetical protein